MQKFSPKPKFTHEFLSKGRNPLERKKERKKASAVPETLQDIQTETLRARLMVTLAACWEKHNDDSGTHHLNQLKWMQSFFNRLERVHEEMPTIFSFFWFT
jgi:hypothetical protein